MTPLLILLAALIQVRGQPLQGGTAAGSATLPLERAVGGDTPVLALGSARGRLRLLLDTGATSTMVTPELVQRLGLRSSDLPPSGFALAGGGSGCGGLRPRRTLLPDLELRSRPGAGSWRLRGVEALVIPAAALPPGVDGVLGAPTLRLQPIWVDPLNDRLAVGAAALRLAVRHGTAEQRLQPNAGAQSLAGSGSGLGPARGERLRLRWLQGVPLLGLRTPIGVVPALADTGAEGLFVSPDLARRLPLLGSGRSLRLVGFCGEQPVQQFSSAGLGPTGYGNTSGSDRADPGSETHALIVTPNPIFQTLGVEAIVGQELFHQRRQLWRLDLDPPLLVLD